MTRSATCTRCGSPLRPERDRVALAGICPGCLARDLLGEADAPSDPAVSTVKAPQRWEPPTPPKTPTGVPFGKYLKVERLAERRDVEAWKAWDTAAGRWVLLNILYPESSTSATGQRTRDFLARSHFEAVHETGEAEGRPFVALRWVQPGPHPPSPEISGPVTPQPVPNAAENRLGPYRLLKKLGEGGMGTVYLAQEPKGGRKVALKLLPKSHQGGDDSALKRFRREASAAIRLSHPNLVRAYAVGEDRGFPYYVMEYFEGETLESRLRREKTLGWAEVLDIGAAIAAALEHAHANGFVHRDVKPANILVTKQSVPKLLDLGISKNQEDLEGSFRTESGIVIGTPHYLSPEQAQGPEALDGRSDIYSLGATLYHLVTGRVPYTGTTPLEIVAQHLHGEVPDPAVFRPDLPPAGAALIRRMLAKSPEERFRNCGELLRELRRLRRAAGPMYRRPEILAGVAGAAALLLLSLLLRPRGPEPVEPVRVAAAAPLKKTPLPPDPNLLAYYRMDKVGAASARRVGEVGSSEDVPAPEVGNAGSTRSARFSRQQSPNYLELPSTPVLDAVNLGSYSIAAWVKPLRLPPPTGTDDAFSILMKQGWHEGLSFGGKGWFVMSHVLEGTSPLFLSAADFGGEPLPPNQWYYVVGVVDLGAAQVRCYVNGILKGQTLSIPPDSRPRNFQSMPWRIGLADPTPGSGYAYQMDGLIHDARIYKYALTEPEIRSLCKGRDRRDAGPAPALAPAVADAQPPPARKAALRDRGLVARWKFDEETGTRAEDSSGAGNHGTLVHAPARSPQHPPVKYPNPGSIAFDFLKEQCIEVSDSPSLKLTGSLTLSAWVRPMVRTDHQQGIIEKWEWTGTEARGGYFLRLNKECSASFHLVPASGGPQGLLTSASVPLGIWSHVAGVYDPVAHSARIYVDGTCRSSSGFVDPPAAGNQVLRLGSDYSENRFNGFLDDLRIYDRALTDEEVRSLAAGDDVPDPGPPPAKPATDDPGKRPAVLPAPEPGLVGYWKFDEESGTRAYDSSGHELHGTFFNDPDASALVPSLRFENRRSRSFAQGRSQHVEVGSVPSLHLTASFTLAAWVRLTATTEHHLSIIEKFEWDGSAARGGFSLRLFAHRNLCMMTHPAKGAGGGASTTGEDRISIGVWTHVAGVYRADSRTIQLFVNGALEATEHSVPASAASDAHLRIGSDYGANEFNGQIDEVRIYNRALTPEEIGSLASGNERAGESKK